MLTMMRSLKNEGQLKEFLQLQNSKEKCDEMLQKNEDEINKNRDSLRNSEDSKASVETNEETLKRRDEIVAEMVELLKHSGDTSIYSELHRMEGIMARARVNWQEQQLMSRDTSNEEETQGTVGPNSFVNRCVNEVNSLPGERYQCASKTHSRGNRTSVSSKSTTTKRVMLLELEAMKKQDEIDEQLDAKKRQAEIRKKHEEMDKLTEELEIAKLQEEKASARESQKRKWKSLRRREAEQAQVCEASRQYPSTAIRSKRYLLGLMKMDVTRKQRSLEKRYPESHWPATLSNHNLTLCHTQRKSPT